MANKWSGAGPLTSWRPVNMSRRPTFSGGALQLGLQPAERVQALLERGVVRENVHQGLLRSGRDDEEGAHAFGLAQVLTGDTFHRAADLEQRRGKRAGPAGEHRRATVGGELAVARERLKEQE